MLDEDEVAFLRRYPGHRGMLLAAWAMRVIDDAIRQPWTQKIFTPPERGGLYNRVNAEARSLTARCRDVADMLAMPVPFPYYHIMNLIQVLVFGIMGYALAFYDTYLTAIPYTCILLLFMGLREVSTSLADPFGKEETDFPLSSFMNHTFENSVALLMAADICVPELAADPGAPAASSAASAASTNGALVPPHGPGKAFCPVESLHWKIQNKVDCEFNEQQVEMIVTDDVMYDAVLPPPPPSRFRRHVHTEGGGKSKEADIVDLKWEPSGHLAERRTPVSEWVAETYQHMPKENGAPSA